MAKIVERKKINDLQVITYSTGMSIVKTGNTRSGKTIFQSDDKVVTETFATMYPELIEREFKVHGVIPFASAWFSRQYPTHMFGTEQYDRFRNKLVKFIIPMEGEKLGFIKIN